MDARVKGLVEAAKNLADRSIGHEVGDLPFCQICYIGGLSGEPIQHLDSCAVGQVLAAIEGIIR